MKYIIKKEYVDSFIITDNFGAEVAETTKEDWALALVKDPLIENLRMENVHDILVNRMGWELIDVAAFFAAAANAGLLNWKG